MNKVLQIRAQSFNRKTGKPTSKSRIEEIDLESNELFRECESILEVKNVYENYWNELNPHSDEVVFVSEVIV